MDLKLNTYKLFLIFLGFGLLYFISGTLGSIIFLFISSLFVIVLFKIIEVIESKFILNIFNRFSVPFAFLILICLNLSGKINTLTGINESNKSIFLFLAMPFYLLSAFALISDCADEKIKKIKKKYAVIDLMLYIVYPFKLLSGPLEQPKFIEQFNKIKFRNTSHRIYIAASWIILGLFMKFVIGNRLSPVEMITFVNPLMSFICAAIFELKFYFDFAGYSFIAYGFSKLFNVNILKNFNHPFTTTNVVKFWQNWHISLGKFLQKYILYKFVFFISSRDGKALFACFIFIISALWHGITFNYLLWGLFHGIIYFLYVQYFKKINISHFIGYLSMFAFFVFGRFLAIEANTSRLLEKMSNFFKFNEYSNFSSVEYEFIENFLNLKYLSFLFGIVVAIIFITLEFIQLSKNKKSYFFFRKPISLIIMFVMFVFFGMNSGELLYARI